MKKLFLLTLLVTILALVVACGGQPATEEQAQPVEEPAKAEESQVTQAGLTIGTGNLVADNYGEAVVDGPFFGSEYAQRQVGKQMFTARYLRFWYRTTEH